MPEPTSPDLDAWLADINADRASWPGQMVDELISLRAEGYRFEPAWLIASRRVGRPPARKTYGWGTLKRVHNAQAESPLAFAKRVMQAAYEGRELEPLPELAEVA